MIKKCNVTFCTNKVAVAIFDGKEIQIPYSDLIQNGIVYIRYSNGIYTVVSESDFSKENIENSTKKTSRKNRNKDTEAKNIEVDTMIDSEE